MKSSSKLGLAVSIMLLIVCLFPFTAGAADETGKSSKIIGEALASSVTATRADITADITKNYTPNLYVGTDPEALSLTKGYASLLGSKYVFQLTDLKPGTTYYYQVKAVSGKKIVRSGVYKFTTLSEAEPLIISGIQAYSTETTKTKFEWTTNHNATSTLYYGLVESNLDQKAITADDGGTLHLAYAEQLKPGTTYYYQVAAQDSFGNYVKSGVYKFTTLGETEPLIISGIQAYSTETTKTKFEWTTNHNATSTLYYGLVESNLDQKAITADDGGTFHLAYAEQFKPGTTYYYQVVAQDSFGNYVKSDIYKFTTLNDSYEFLK